MIIIMQASADELILLLKKWESQSKTVVAVGLIQPAEGFRCVIKVSGLVHLDEAGATFSIGDMEKSFTLCDISIKNVGYSIGKDIEWEDGAAYIVDPAEVEELVILANPDRSTLSLYALISH
jgi:hypothetical protein